MSFQKREYVAYETEITAENMNDIQDELIRLEEEKADKSGGVTPEQYLYAFPTDTVSGAIASFVDGADELPVKALSISITPAQTGSGDPAPANVRPISGRQSAAIVRAGKNLFDGAWEPGALNVNTGAEVSSATSIRTGMVPLKGGQTYTVSWAGGAYYLLFCAYHADGSFSRYLGAQSQNGSILTLNSDESAIRFYAYNATVAPEAMQIEPGTRATAYEPHHGAACTVAFPSAAGTVYGGTLNMTTGVLTVDTVYLQFDGTENWYINNRSNPQSNRFFLANVIPKQQNPGPLSSISSIAKNELSGNFDTPGKFAAYAFNSQTGWIGFAMDKQQYPDTESFKSLLSQLAQNNTPCQSVVTVSPQTYQLTPAEVTTLLGANNIWADCGDAAVTYRADPTLFVTTRLPS